MMQLPFRLPIRTLFPPGFSPVQLTPRFLYNHVSGKYRRSRKDLYSFIKTENITGDGVLFNIGFTIKTDAAVGDSAVSIAVEEMANADAAIYTGYTVAAGNVKIGEATFIYGDVDANGTVEATDALWALQAYVGSRQLVDNAFKAADVNLDNTVDTSDALAILQFAVRIRTELPIKK